MAGFELTVLPFQNAEVHDSTLAPPAYTEASSSQNCFKGEIMLAKGAHPSASPVIAPCVTECSDSTLSECTAALKNRNTRFTTLTIPGLLTTSNRWLWWKNILEKSRGVSARSAASSCGRTSGSLSSLELFRMRFALGSVIVGRIHSDLP